MLRTRGSQVRILPGSLACWCAPVCAVSRKPVNFREFAPVSSLDSLTLIARVVAPESALFCAVCGGIARGVQLGG